MRIVKGVTDLRAEKLRGTPATPDHIDRQAVARAGITPGSEAPSSSGGLRNERLRRDGGLRQ